MKKLLLILILVLCGMVSGTPYIDTVMSIGSANLKGYWPMGEDNGAVALDVSGNSLDGTYTSCILNQPAMGAEKSIQMSTGSNVDLYSDSLADLFNDSEGTLMLWFKSAAVPYIGTQHLLRLGNSGKYFDVYLKNDSTEITSICDSQNLKTYTMINKVGRRDSVTNANEWHSLIIRWSADSNVIDEYLDDVRVFYGPNDNVTGRKSYWLGWTDSVITTVKIGETFTGNVANFAMWNTRLTRSEINRLGRSFKKHYNLVCFGDSETHGVIADGATLEHRSYPATLARMLDKSYLSSGLSGGPLENTTVAVYGNKPYPDNGVDTYKYRVLDYQPEYVFLMYGTNDALWFGYHFVMADTAKFESNYDTIVENCKLAGIDSNKIYISTLPFYNSGNDAAGGMAPVNRAIIRIARRHNIKLVELNAGMREYVKLTGPDNLHMTTYGYETIGRIMYNQMYNTYPNANTKYWNSKTITIKPKAITTTKDTFIYQVNLNSLYSKLPKYSTQIGVYNTNTQKDVPKIICVDRLTGTMSASFIGDKTSVSAYKIYWGDSVAVPNDAEKFYQMGKIGNFFPFDDSLTASGGTTFDRIVPTRKFTKSGASTNIRASILGSSVNGVLGTTGMYNGTNTVFPSYSNDSTFTIQYLLKYEGMPSKGASFLFNNYSTATNECGFYGYADSIKWYQNNGTSGTVVKTNISFVVGSWYHIAATFNGYGSTDTSIMHLYVNGQRSSTAMIGTASKKGASGNGQKIGHLTDAGYNIVGDIDNLIITTNYNDDVYDTYNMLINPSVFYDPISVGSGGKSLLQRIGNYIGIGL